MDFSLDLTNVDENAPLPSTSYEPLPAGEYKGVFTTCDPEMKTNPKGEQYLGAKVVFQVIEGKHSGTEVRDYFIFRHEGSEKAQEIGQRKLKQWCVALNERPNINPDTLPGLLNRPVVVKLSVTKSRTQKYYNKESGEYEDRTFDPSNRIEAIMSAGSPASKPAARPAAAAPQPVSAQPPERKPANAARMPWEA